MKAVFLTEALPGSGLGHVMRCSAYAAAFRDLGVEARLVVRGGAKGLPPEAEQAEWFEVPARFAGNDTMVFVDSYSASEPVYRALHQTSRSLAVLDDYNRLSYPCDSIINSAPGSESLYQPLRQDVTYLTGVSYAALRREFWDVPPRDTNENLRDILVCMGGDDALDLTPRIVQAFYPGFRVAVVLGPGARDQEYPDNVRVMRSVTAGQMRGLMCASDAAFSGGGQTVYELARCGLPFVPVKTASNQTANLEGLRRAGLIDRWLDPEAPDWDSQIQVALGNLASPVERRRISARLQQEVDGRGPRRIAEAVLAAVKSNQWTRS